MNNFWTAICTGVVGGVATGVILALYFELQRKCIRWWEREEQIKYLAALIEDARKKILEVEKLRLPDPPMPAVDSSIFEDIRSSYHKKFRVELTSTLSNRCTRMTYDEREQVSEIFLRHHEIFPDSHFSRANHVERFSMAESITWLGLKPMKRDLLVAK